MANLKFVGIGGAFAPISDGNSNMLLFSDEGKILAIDFGGTAPYIIRDEWGIPLKEIDALYLSHLHDDHVSGTGQFLLSRYFMPKMENGVKIKPKLFAMRKVMGEAWEMLKHNAETLAGQICTLTTYFECFPQDGLRPFLWEHFELQPVQTIHIVSGHLFRESYGLIIKNLNTGKKIFVTTDTQFAPHQLTDFYKEADIVFHDCELLPFRTGVHANIMDLRTLPPEVRNKMWLYHYQPELLPAHVDKLTEDGFLGFVSKGQEFQF